MGISYFVYSQRGKYRMHPPGSYSDSFKGCSWHGNLFACLIAFKIMQGDDLSPANDCIWESEYELFPDRTQEILKEYLQVYPDVLENPEYKRMLKLI